MTTPESRYRVSSLFALSIILRVRIPQAPAVALMHRRSMMGEYIVDRYRWHEVKLDGG